MTHLGKFSICIIDDSSSLFPFWIYHPNHPNVQSESESSDVKLQSVGAAVALQWCSVMRRRAAHPNTSEIDF